MLKLTVLLAVGVLFNITNALGQNAASNKQRAYIMLSCYSDGCTYSAIQNKIKIRDTANGTLIGATATECETSHKNKPETYTCKKSESRLTLRVTKIRR